MQTHYYQWTPTLCGFLHTYFASFSDDYDHKRTRMSYISPVTVKPRFIFQQVPSPNITKFLLFDHRASTPCQYLCTVYNGYCSGNHFLQHVQIKQGNYSWLSQNWVRIEERRLGSRLIQKTVKYLRRYSIGIYSNRIGNWMISETLFTSEEI